MGEIKRRAFGCEVRSGGLALLVKDTSRGGGECSLKLKRGIGEVRASIDKKTTELLH